MTLGRLSIQVFANFVGLGSNDRLIIRDVKVLSWSAWLIWCHWLLYSSLLAPGYFWEGRAWWYPLTSASFPSYLAPLTSLSAYVSGKGGKSQLPMCKDKIFLDQVTCVAGSLLQVLSVLVSFLRKGNPRFMGKVKAGHLSLLGLFVLTVT